MRQIDAAQFPRHTLPAELRDYPRWHRGRPHYAVWMVEVQQPALLAYIQQLQEQLADLLHPPGARQPHLTLFVCGFPQANQRYADDFTPARLDSQLQHLRPRAGSACVLPLGAADSFASAAFIPVYDPQQRLANWRQALAAGSREIRQADYIAHITLGLYRQRIAAATLRQRLAALPMPQHALQVERLDYAHYASSDQFSRLERQLSISLAPR